MDVFLYARKSTESEDRQVQSIDDQLRMMRRKANDLWHTIIEEFIESKSAKNPWRPVFNEMLKRIETSEVKGIISYKIDRLARNSVDSWLIQHMLQRRELELILTSDREYHPCDAWLILNVESWMAIQYIIDLRKNVLRGMNSKIAKWWRPWVVPEGYKNCREDGIIVIDEVNFKLIRKMFDLFLTGNYTVSQIRDIANNKWWYRTRKKKRSWWKPLSASGIYRMFWNIFYTGNFLWNGEIYPWKHTPLLSTTEFNRVQELLWTKWRQRPKKREYSYTWLIKCWECGCGITAEDKSRHIKSTWVTHYYTYYHCTKKRKHLKCQQKVITLQKIEQQITDILWSIEILPQFKEWALEILKKDFHKELEEREIIYDNLQKQLKIQENKLHNLTDLLLEDRIDKDDFDRRKVWIKEDIRILEEEISNISNRRDEKVNKISEFFEFSTSIVDSFNLWDTQTRRNIFSSLGQNFVLKDWKLAIELYPWIKPLENDVVRLTSEYKRIETNEKSTTTGSSNAFDGLYLQWWTDRGSNPGPIA